MTSRHMLWTGIRAQALPPASLDHATFLLLVHLDWLRDGILVAQARTPGYSVLPPATYPPTPSKVGWFVFTRQI